MYRFLLYAILVFIFCGFQNSALAQDKEGINTIEHLKDGSVLLESFEKYQVGTIPSDWYNQKGERRPHTYGKKNKSGYKYSVQIEDGDKFLRYAGVSAKHLNFPLVNKDINIYNTPILSWKWRVLDVPKGANEDDDDRNDVAASMYVVFDLGRVLFKKVPKSIRYTWSSSLPKGTELSKFFGNQKVVVIGTGSEGTNGKWRTFQRNIVEDYKRLFGDDPPETPLAILILSEGDSTGQTAKADYDDIKLLPSKN